MKFWVLNYIQAQSFRPEIPTLAIRIFDPGANPAKDSNHPGNSLLSSPNWVAEMEYTFSDDDLWLYDDSELTSTSFNSILAQRLLLEFKRYLPKVSGVMLHCNAGHSRSPAVALALIDKFRLTPEWGNARTRGKMRTVIDTPRHHRMGLNNWVYHLLMDTVVQ